MLEDIKFNLTYCDEPGCVVANVVLLVGSFLLGIWMAYEVWRKPWRSHFRALGMNPYGMSLDDFVPAAPVRTELKARALPALARKPEPEEDKEGEMVDDPRLGRVYRRKPYYQDDLKRIQGISYVLENKLHYYGVYRFAQIANWTPEQASEFAQRLTLTDQIQRDRWVAQAQELAGADALKLAKPATPAFDYELLILSRFAGDEVQIDDELGIIYLDEPEIVDDLQQVQGIGDRFEAALNSLGVYRLKQIALWNPVNVGAAAARLGIPAERIHEEAWVSKAGELYRKLYNASPYWRVPTPSLADYHRKIQAEYPGEPVKADQSFGIVYTREPAETDDLRKIRGMTDEAFELLRQRGVYRFKQVAGWSEANVDHFARLLQFHPERIYRDGWISQAAELARSVPRREAQLV